MCWTELGSGVRSPCASANERSLIARGFLQGHHGSRADGVERVGLTVRGSPGSDAIGERHASIERPAVDVAFGLDRVGLVSRVAWGRVVCSTDGVLTLFELCQPPFELPLTLAQGLLRLVDLVLTLGELGNEGIAASGIGRQILDLTEEFRFASLEDGQAFVEIV